MYPIELVTPMAKELTDNGFEALNTPEQVDDFMANQEGTALVVINSVCGCAAANARPGARLSLTHTKRPEKLYTVFAGVDKEATRKMRDYLLPYPPSSPSMALFKNGELVHFIQRLEIEGHSAQMVASNLANAYNQHC